MLSEMQKTAFEKGFSLYREYCSFDNKKCDAALNKLAEACDTLDEHFDYKDKSNDLDSLFYQVIFANVIQDLQDSGEFELLPAIYQDMKMSIYLRTLKWFVNMEQYVDEYKPFLWSVFNKLGRAFINGEEIAQNDDLAWRCADCNKKLSHPMAAILLESFERGADGKWVYTGVRPQ